MSDNFSLWHLFIKEFGWHVSDSITKELVIKAFLKAYWKRKPRSGFIHHSDRGSQYISKDFHKLLRNVGARYD